MNKTYTFDLRIATASLAATRGFVYVSVAGSDEVFVKFQTAQKIVSARVVAFQQTAPNAQIALNSMATFTLLQSSNANIPLPKVEATDSSAIINFSSRDSITLVQQQRSDFELEPCFGLKVSVLQAYFDTVIDVTQQLYFKIQLTVES